MSDVLRNRNKIPKNIKNLRIGHIKNEIEPLTLPDTIECLDTGVYNFELKKGVFPSSLKKLVLGQCYCEKIEKGIIPNSITHLKLSYDSLDINDLLPDFLQSLIIDGHIVNEITKNLLPNTLKHLYLGYYNIELKPNCLPDSLNFLHVGTTYYHKIKKNVLPPLLKHLKLGYGYRELIDDDSISMPDSLTKITYEKYYSIKINLKKKALPITLKDLEINSLLDYYRLYIIINKSKYRFEKQYSNGKCYNLRFRLIGIRVKYYCLEFKNVSYYQNHDIVFDFERDFKLKSSFRFSSKFLNKNRLLKKTFQD